MSIQEIITYLTNSQEIIRTGGLLLVTLIVFAENGLFFGFFLPGDYLLFSAGLLCGTRDFDVPIWLLFICIYFAAITGSYTGYLFGKLLGGKLLHRSDSWYFKRDFIIKTRYYYIKYAGNTLIIGRFLPIVRTFAPILAGIIRMNQQKFLIYNILGATIWVSLLVLGGFFLGQAFPDLLHYLEYIIFGFVLLTSVVVLKGLFSSKKRKPKVVKT